MKRLINRRDGFRNVRIHHLGADTLVRRVRRYVAVLVLSACTLFLAAATRDALPAGSAEMSIFVPSELPVYVSGQRVDPRNGGHWISLSREKGLAVDGISSLPVSEFPKYMRPARTDGLHYIVDTSLRIGSEQLANGGVEAARHAMLEYWSQYGDSLTVNEYGSDQYELTLGRESVIVPVPEAPYEPDSQLLDNYDSCLVPRFHSVVEFLEKGYLLLCGNSYFYRIDPSDAEIVQTELENLGRRARKIATLDGTPIYRSELVGGKYVLTTSVVRDFADRRK